jgi:hypothetical protein
VDRGRVNANATTAAGATEGSRTTFKADNAVNLGEDGVIGADSRVVAGIDVGAPLADNDGACRYKFATVGFDP